MLRNHGVHVGKLRLQKHGIHAKGKKWLKAITDSNHDMPIAPTCLTVSSPWVPGQGVSR
jgi:hypothetical protein